MGWQTDALIHVWFNRQTFNSKSDVESYIKDIKDESDVAKKTLHQLAFMTEPQKFIGKDTDPLWWIQNQLEEAIETIEVNSYFIGIANDVLDGWDDMHNEKGIAKHLDYEDFDKYRRLSGDFVEDEKTEAEES